MYPLDRQRRKPRIGYKPSIGAGCAHEAVEDRAVSGPSQDDKRIGRVQQSPGKGERFCLRGWRRKRVWIGRHSNSAARHVRRDAEARRAVYLVVEPSKAACVMNVIAARSLVLPDDDDCNDIDIGVS